MRIAHDLNQRQANDMEGWFLRHMPPDDELLDLIEWAFLDGQIDGFALDLAHILLINQGRQLMAQLAH